MDETKLNAEDKHSISKISSKSCQHHSSHRSHDEVSSHIRVRQSALMNVSRTRDEMSCDSESGRSKFSYSHIRAETISNTPSYVESVMTTNVSVDGSLESNNRGKHCYICHRNEDLKVKNICTKCLTRFVEITKQCKIGSQASVRGKDSGMPSHSFSQNQSNDRVSTKMLSKGSEPGEPEDGIESVSSIKTMEMFSSQSTKSSISKQSKKVTSSESSKLSLNKDIDDLIPQSQDEIISGADEENSQTTKGVSSHLMKSSISKRSDVVESTASIISSSQAEKVSEAGKEKSQKSYRSNKTNSYNVLENEPHVSIISIHISKSKSRSKEASLISKSIIATERPSKSSDPSQTYSIKAHSKSKSISSAGSSIKTGNVKSLESEGDQSHVSKRDSINEEISSKSISIMASEKPLKSSEPSQADSCKIHSESIIGSSAGNSMKTESIKLLDSKQEQSNVSKRESMSDKISTEPISVMATERSLKPNESNITGKAESHSDPGLSCQYSESVPVIEVEYEEESGTEGCICSPDDSKADSLNLNIEPGIENLESQAHSVETKTSEKISQVTREALSESIGKIQIHTPAVQCETEINTDKSNVSEDDNEHKNISQNLSTTSKANHCSHINIYVDIININQLLCNKHHPPMKINMNIKQGESNMNNNGYIQNSVDESCNFQTDNCCTIERNGNRIIIKIPSLSCAECANERRQSKDELENLHETHAIQLCASCENTFILCKSNRSNANFELLSESTDNVREVFEKIQKILPDCSCSPNCHHDSNKVDSSIPPSEHHEDQMAMHDTVSKSGCIPCDSLTQGLMIAQYITDTTIMFKWDIPEIPGIYGYELYINNRKMHTLKCPSMSWTIFEDIPLTSNKIDIKCILDSDDSK